MATERLHYLDWLKVLIVYGIVLFHISLIFSGSWVVNNATHSLLLSAFAAFTFPWGIPAMFLIAGADAWFTLRSHSPAYFLRARFLRLLVPLFPGILLLSPLQYFFISQSPPPDLHTFVTFYPHFFASLSLPSAWDFIRHHWLHLWFLPYLFAVSCVCLPILLFLRKPHSNRLGAFVFRLASHPFGLLAFALPLLVSQIFLRPFFPDYQGIADVTTYLFVFLLGALLVRDPRLQIFITRYIRLHLAFALAVTFCLGLVLLVLPFNSPEAPSNPLVLRLAYAALYPLYVWSWLLIVLFLGLRYLNFPARIQQYARDSVLPVYIIHHPVVIVVSSYIVTWNLPLWPKFFLIVFVSFSLILLIYEFGVRRFAPLRFAFGLKARPRARHLPLPI